MATEIKTSSQKRDFGFKEVPLEEKTKLVKNIFDSVSLKYDLMNDLMSMGFHRLWKNYLIHKIQPKPNYSYLDVASGSADIACGIYKALQKNNHKPSHMTLCDINEDMLTQGWEKTVNNGLYNEVDFACADAEKLPFIDNSYDIYTISFGLRNVTTPYNAMKEAYRVLKPGGRFLCLEFSHVILPIFKQFYDSYSFNVIPLIGKKITGNSEAYQYLVESIRRFPKQKELVQMLSQAGFEHVTYQNLNGGIVCIHSGWKL